MRVLWSRPSWRRRTPLLDFLMHMKACIWWSLQVHCNLTWSAYSKDEVYLKSFGKDNGISIDKNGHMVSIKIKKMAQKSVLWFLNLILAASHYHLNIFVIFEDHNSLVSIFWGCNFHWRHHASTLIDHFNLRSPSNSGQKLPITSLMRNTFISNVFYSRYVYVLDFSYFNKKTRK